MPKQVKTKVSAETQKKLKVIKRLQETGVKGKAEFLALTAKDMVEGFVDLTNEEFCIICAMQKAVSDGELFEFLFKSE